MMMRRIAVVMRSQSCRTFRSSVVVCGGGGGGRPGGRPVLNWKQKKMLDMGVETTTSKALELDAVGDYEELEKLFDLSKAKIVDITDMDEYREGDEVDDEDDTATLKSLPSMKKVGGKKKKHDKGPRPFLQMSQLFGSHKVAYKLPDLHDPKREKKRFSHTRIFGVAKKAQHGEQ